MAKDLVHDEAVTTGIPEVPVTQQRPVPVNLDQYIKNPGAPRATRAVSKEKPHGSDNSADNRTVLQQHVDFWDFDHDGFIYPMDTYNGFRKLGYNVVVSFLAIFFIHGSFSYASQGTWLPDPFFSINTNNIHKTKHGSDSEVYDTEGRFVPEKFEELFTKFDRRNRKGLDFHEMWELSEANRNIIDPTGWTAEKLEWWATWFIAGDKNGLVSKETIRGVYDGTWFYQQADKIKAEKARKAPSNGRNGHQD
ncbi:hypothetical protein WJX74_003320 [Apatococcus lobatus]|uniref:Caleosin n=1 Tax=Apatococcus lobatus TaxID=904363 RepID=A0AAW1R1S3_9CHLO